MKTHRWLMLMMLVSGSTPLGAEPPRHDHVMLAGGIAPPAASGAPRAPADAQSISQGEQLFSAMNCDGCHGAGGTGFVGPSLVDGRWRFGGEDQALFHSIYAGRPHGMPAYGGMLTEATIWQLVSYLQAQPAPANVPTTSWR